MAEKMLPQMHALLGLLERSFEQQRDKATPPPFPLEGQTGAVNLPKEKVMELNRLLRSGEKVKAVKRVTQLTGAGLRVAKDYVDDLERKVLSVQGIMGQRKDR
jgi:ribosomal protein L7/L12